MSATGFDGFRAGGGAQAGRRCMGTRERRVALALALLCLLGALALGSAASASAAIAVSVSPLNGTPDASPDTQISFLGVPSNEIARVSVTGSRSGRHTGRLAGYVSAAGASFLPSHPF